MKSKCKKQVKGLPLHPKSFYQKVQMKVIVSKINLLQRTQEEIITLLLETLKRKKSSFRISKMSENKKEKRKKMKKVLYFSLRL